MGKLRVLAWKCVAKTERMNAVVSVPIMIRTVCSFRTDAQVNASTGAVPPRVAVTVMPAGQSTAKLPRTCIRRASTTKAAGPVQDLIMT